MSDQFSPAEKRAVGPLDRIGRNAFAMVQVALAFLAFIAVNYLSFHHWGRADLSRSADYTISEASVRLLKSESLANRGKKVRWILCFRRTAPFYERVRAMAEEYARQSHGKIELEVVDPLRSPDRMQEVTAEFGLTLVRDLMVIDARNDDSPAIREDEKQIKSLHPHVRLVLADDLSVHAVDGSVRKITGFRGEDIMTARLIEALEGTPKKVGLVLDKTRFRAEAVDSPLVGLAERARLLNVELVPVRIAGLKTLPDDLAGLVIAAPAFDLTTAEMAVLEEYWQRPRAALMVFADSAGVPSKLKAFLRKHGITPRNDRVVRPLKNGTTTEINASFSRGIPYMAGLGGQSTSFEGDSASLEVREGADDLIAKRIFPMVAVSAVPDAWGETRFGSEKHTFDPTEDTPPVIHLAAICTRGAESDDRFAESSARMAVFGNVDFLSPSQGTRAENLDFLHSTLNWLVGREAPAGIGPRPLGVYRLPLLSAQVSFINRVNLIFLPLGLLMVGGFVWSSRRV